MLIWLSCAKLRARPVDDEASKMRWRNKEQYERPKRVVRLCFWGKSSSFVNGRLFADLGSKQAKNWTNATVAQLVEQRIRNAQAVGSSPTSSSKTCVNTAFSQVFYFSEMNFKIQYAKKSHSFLWSEILFVYSIFSPRPSIDHLWIDFIFAVLHRFCWIQVDWYNSDNHERCLCRVFRNVQGLPRRVLDEIKKYFFLE